MDVGVLLLLAATGFVAGMLNTLAGAASLLTLPLLIFTGLDASAANATNRVAILVQNGVAVATYRSSGLPGGKTALALACPATIAAVTGAWLATRTPEPALRAAIGLAMVVFLAVTLYALPRLRKKDRGLAAEVEPNADLRMHAVMTMIGLLSGYLQTGTGILILLYLSTARGIHLVVANRVKVTVTLLTTAGALATFVMSSTAVDLRRGGVLAVGMGLGAYIGAKSSLKRGERVILAAVVLAVAFSATKLLWDAWNAITR